MLSLLPAAGIVDACPWESFKSAFEETAIRLGTIDAADKRALQASLTSTLRSLVEAEKERPGVFRDGMTELNRQLLGIVESRHTGALMRSRELRFDYEERHHKVFLPFERKKNKLKAIAEVVHAGMASSGPPGVHQAFDQFYEALPGTPALQDQIPLDVLDLIPKTT